MWAKNQERWYHTDSLPVLSKKIAASWKEKKSASIVGRHGRELSRIRKGRVIGDVPDCA